LPPGRPGIGQLIEGAMQQAAQPVRQAIGGWAGCFGVSWGMAQPAFLEVAKVLLGTKQAKVGKLTFPLL